LIEIVLVHLDPDEAHAAFGTRDRGRPQAQEGISDHLHAAETVTEKEMERLAAGFDRGVRVSARRTAAIVTVMCGARVKLRCSRDCDCREFRAETLRDGVIATMPVYLALRTFFLDIGDFSTRRQFAVASDHASTGESSKP
jgi:hypothetical protein